MDGRFSELELLFIAEVLDQHGEFLTDLLVEEIESKSLISDEDREHLLENISYNTSKYGINPVLVISFPAYGRFIEINYHKRSKNTGILDQESANRALWGRQNKQQAKRDKKKKDTRWYSKNVYGSLNRLIGILMYEFSEEERARLTNLLEQQKRQVS
jgi:hypothetical protein